MNAPERKVLDHPVPHFLQREQPARFGWWSDRTLMIVKGDETMILDADDMRALGRFVEGCNVETQI